VRKGHAVEEKEKMAEGGKSEKVEAGKAAMKEKRL